MRPLTYTRPKVMLPVAGRPILEHLLLEARRAGCTDFIFIVGYCDEKVRSHFGDGSAWGVDIAYSNQRHQTGTADALKMVEGMVAEERFLVMNGDVLVSAADIKQMAHSEGAAMSVIEKENTAGLGVVEIERDRVLRIHEKAANPPGNMINAGLYLLTPQIWEALSQTERSPRGEYEITDTLQVLIDSGGQVRAHKLASWLDVSYPWDLLDANEFLLSNMKAEHRGTVENNAVLKGEVYIGKGTVIRSGCYIEGPVIIGDNCVIGPNCYIRPFTSIGEGCHIGAAVELKESIVMDGSKIPHHNYVGDSIIGEGCNLGAGTKVANLRLDKRHIRISGMDTGRRKLGVIMGDGVETGINSCINVGCIIGNGARIWPGAVVRERVVAPHARIQ